MGPRPLLGMVLAWLAVVVGVGAITFVVVDRTGRAVGRASAADSVVALPSVSASGSSSPQPSTSRPASTPAPSRTVGPSATTRPPRPSPGSTPTVVQAEPRTASFTTDGGTVVASCEGTLISLDSIRPRDGWSFEQEAEHGGLEVKFKSGERQVEILVTCVRGVPTRSES